MAQNVLVTGAAGYIGGAVIAELLSSDTVIKPANITAAVRSEEQAQSLSQLGIKVIQTDFSDEEAAINAVFRNESERRQPQVSMKLLTVAVDIVVQAASMLNASLSIYLIKALGQRRQSTGRNAYFIHSSMTTLYTEEAGWTFGEVRDTDPVFQKQKDLGSGHPVRDTELRIIEEAKALDVRSLIISVPNVYGRGTGSWRKLSVSIPAFIRTSIKLKSVYKFDKDAPSISPYQPKRWENAERLFAKSIQNQPAVHISDIVSLYALLISKILQSEPIPTGEEGYYFAVAHTSSAWETMERLATALYARGLVKDPSPQVWPSYEMAAESLGFPIQHIRAMGTASGQAIPVNAYRLGWTPNWDQKRFFANIDDEVAAVQELDTVRMTLFDSMLDLQAKERQN